MTETTIGEERKEGYILRGEKLDSLIGTSFSATAFLAWFGRKPSDAEATLFEACLVASLDHGANPPSAQTARITASCGKPIADSVASGLLTLGARHGNAGSECAAWLRTHSSSTPADAINHAIADGKRIPGFGHAVYDQDPRAQALIALATKTVAKHQHIAFAQEVSKTLSALKNKAMPLNVDGAIGAICADLGWPDDIADALFILGRTAGLIAHSRESAEQSSSGKYIRPV